MKYYLAIDIGASSGRHIVGWLNGDKIETKEVYRFKNGVDSKDGHLVWNIERLFTEVKNGLKAAKAQGYTPESIGIDTWGVDYALLSGGEAVGDVFAYRDSRTQSVIDLVHALVPQKELYERTGIQFMPFNTIFQLYADAISNRLQRADGFLMLPDYLAYLLTGVQKREYTNATTTGLVNALSHDWDWKSIDKLGLPRALFGQLSAPGTAVGELKPEIARAVGYSAKVVQVATHDTASAVEGIPFESESPYISSGTWSLLGVKVPAALTDAHSRRENYSNEGGVGYFRYQKNIMGMWVVNKLRDELCPDTPFGEIVRRAEESDYEGVCDVNAPAFMAPESMKGAFDAALSVPPQTPWAYFRCAYRSLARSYKQAIEALEQNTGKRYESLYIVGGGAKNEFLNRLTAEQTGKRVIALPIEASAIGNIKIQIESAKNQNRENYL